MSKYKQINRNKININVTGTNFVIKSSKVKISKCEDLSKNALWLINWAPVINVTIYALTRLFCNSNEQQFQWYIIQDQISKFDSIYKLIINI